MNVEIQKKYLGSVKEVQNKGYENCVTSDDVKALREQSEKVDDIIDKLNQLPHGYDLSILGNE